MSDLDELFAELMQDRGFAAEYERLRPGMELSESVIRAREKAGLSREELARKANVSLSAMRRLEDSAKIPGTAALRRIADALGLSLRISLVRKSAA